ncbi:hypothetical protein BOH72_18815 [Mycobacterium sp. WY10]|nr:hypothetical protein BOH72_18815 [Mycobacterium sp. WY10]
MAVRPDAFRWSRAADSATIAGSRPVDTPLYINPGMQAIAAAREDPRFDRIAQTPQALWFGDWSAKTVRDDIGKYLAGAAAAHAVPSIVLYRIPQRDCGSFASGGARDEQEYKEWIQAAAEALKGHREAIVILEPDALPDLGKCEQGDRLGMLQFAVDALSTTGAQVYIDAGHENWLSPAEAAHRLAKVGVNKVAGFSLNVANFYTTQSEVEYAERVRRELSKLGINGAHFVIDIGRNGAGPQRDFCNPPGARLGAAPRLFRGGDLDGLLWIKSPGETDGCGGGPPTGFWAPVALGLLGK